MRCYTFCLSISARMHYIRICINIEYGRAMGGAAGGIGGLDGWKRLYLTHLHSSIKDVKGE